MYHDVLGKQEKNSPTKGIELRTDTLCKNGHQLWTGLLLSALKIFGQSIQYTDFKGDSNTIAA